MTTNTVNALNDRIDGQVLVRGDAGYDQARTVWNAMVDRRPGAIVRCASVSDAARAIRTARELDLEIGVRCGGHSVVGHAVPEDGLMIDLTPMGEVRVDARDGRAWVRGGALLGALDVASQRYGLATTAGNVSHTGVGGLTLGGGMGWLARQYGLSCDNVISLEVVTADGNVVRASEIEHPDLYWALRGGGGNFGVVTEFEFRLHHIGTEALSVELDFPLDQAGAVLRGWRDLNAARRPAGHLRGGHRGRRGHRRLCVGGRPGRRARAGSVDSRPGHPGRGARAGHLLPRTAAARGHRGRS